MNTGGRLWLVDSTKFPISKTVTGAILELDRGALRAALASDGRRVAICPPGER